MKDLKALMGKPDEQGDSMKKDAKLNVLKHLRKMASDMMGDEVDGLKKVTVAAPDTDSLKAGLAKAEDVVDDMPGDDEEADMDLMGDDEENDPESLKAKIAELEAKLAELQS